MEWLVLLLSGGATTYAAWRVRGVREDRRARTAELEQARRVAEEDVTVFGEQLQRLGAELAGRPLGADARADYQLALDAYERAKWDAPRLQGPEAISSLIDTLGSGRYAIACVRASVAGEERPPLREPCFFNPQHGPSHRDVVWTPPGRGTRTLPACRQCAARVERHERPAIRTVRVGVLKVPYWEAGTAWLPYSYGYFTSGQQTGPRVSWQVDTAIAGDWELGHYGDWHGLTRHGDPDEWRSDAG